MRFTIVPLSPQHQHSAACRRHGMTLVELMLSMAVSSMLLVLLASMLQSSLSAYSGQQRRSSATVESRAGLEILRADLRSSCAISAASTSGTDGLMRFIHLPPENAYGSDRIAFLRRNRLPGTSTITTSADQGSVVLVAYAVGFTPDVGGRESQKLYRRQFTSEETYVKLRDYLQLGTELLSEDDWKDIINPQSGSSDSGSSTASAAVSISEPIAFQVIQFRAKPLTALLSQANDPETLNGVAALPQGTLWPESSRPAAVDVLLRVTNRATAAKLDTAEDWRGEGNHKFMLLGRPITPDVYDDDPEVETQQLRIHLPRF